MNKLKFSWLFWGIIMFTIVGLLTIIGFAQKKQYKPYKKLEESIKERAQIYFETSAWYPEKGDSTKIKFEELLENNMIEEPVVDKDKCKGYVLVSNNGIIEYKTFLKCDKYTTLNYDEKGA